MKKILFLLFVAGMVAWLVYFMRYQGVLKTEAERTVILAAEGRVISINPSVGEIGISYSSHIPDCYPIFRNTKVSHPDLLKYLKEGDHVSFEFRAVRLLVKAHGFVPLYVKEITSIQVIEAQGTTKQKMFYCPQ